MSRYEKRVKQKMNIDTSTPRNNNDTSNKKYDTNELHCLFYNSSKNNLKVCLTIDIKKLERERSIRKFNRRK